MACQESCRNSAAVWLLIFLLFSLVKFVSTWELSMQSGKKNTKEKMTLLTNDCLYLSVLMWIVDFFPPNCTSLSACFSFLPILFYVVKLRLFHTFLLYGVFILGEQYSDRVITEIYQIITVLACSLWTRDCIWVLSYLWRGEHFLSCWVIVDVFLCWRKSPERWLSTVGLHVLLPPLYSVCLVPAPLTWEMPMYMLSGKLRTACNKFSASLTWAAIWVCLHLCFLDFLHKW